MVVDIIISFGSLAGVLAGGVWFRVVRAAVIIPADVDASVLHSAVLGGFDAGVVRPPYAFGEINSCELGVFRFQCFLIILLRLILNKHS